MVSKTFIEKLTGLAEPLKPVLTQPLHQIQGMTIRNLEKVWKTEMGHLQGDRAWPRGPKSQLFRILQYRDHYH